MNELNDHIAKYIKGELPPSEMHELEKKALNDPFLAEALDGAQKIGGDQFNKDLEEINKKLIPVRGKFFWPLGIAASVILLITITYFFVNVDSNDETTLALKESAPVEEILPASDSLAADTEGNQKDSNLAYTSEPVDQVPKQATDIQTSKELEKSSSLAAAGATAQDDQIALNDEIEISSRDQLFEAQEENTKATTEKVELAAPEQATARSRKEASLTEAATISQDKIEEVKAKKVAPIAKSDLAPTPAISMKAYQDYLKSNLNYPSSAIENKVGGEVTVSFIVRSNGQLSDFQIEQGIGFGCDEELIRLIKEGPEWIPASANNKPIDREATVNFLFQPPK